MEHELNSLTVGHTKNINGHVVTRWSENSFEVGTWGRETMTLAQTLAFLAGYDARSEGKDTLWNPFEYLYHKAEHDSWRAGWLRHQQQVAA